MNDAASALASRPHRPGRLPTGLIGLLVLVLVVEGWVRRHDRDFTSVWAAAWRQAGRQATRAETAQADVLCLGDSLVMLGVAPKVLAQTLGRPAQGLAVFKGQAPTAYFLLRRAIEAGAAPRAVLLDGELMAEDPRLQTRLWIDLLTPAELWDLARAAHDPVFAAEVSTGQVLASVRQRHEIQRALLGSLAAEPFSARYEVIPRLRNWRANAGAQIEADVAPEHAWTDARVVALLEQQQFAAGPWFCHPLNQVYVERLLDLAASQGIAVYWLFPPVQAEVQRRRDAASHTATADAFVDGLMARFPNLAVLDGRPGAYPPDHFTDMTHLSRSGAVAFSEAVAAALAPRLDTPLPPEPAARRIVLRPYAPPQHLAAVEDLGASVAALQQAAAARRETRRR